MKEISLAVQIGTSRYRNWSSFVMETEYIRAEIIPGLGAKIVSLCYKPTDKEWLVDAGGRKLVQPKYGSSFGQADMSGWDEVFPTIDPCEAPGYGGHSLPDHGEVWPLSWDCEFTEREVSCSVEGVAGPYRLTRKLSFPATDQLQMDYCVVNHGTEPLPFIWVPHPQFWVSEPTHIVLPSTVQEMVCVFGGNTQVTGKHYAWKELSMVGETQTGDGRKYYIPGIHKEGWCGLVGANSGEWLRMSTDPKKVPYLGIWVDEGMGNDRNVIALEPSIGYYDRLDRAIGNGTAPVIKPGQTIEWSLSVSLGTGGIQAGFDLE
ncbi:hypothetical protein ACFQ3W_22890 [Paenibacillus puldeungensis]|uniref:Galactose mutarotase n=1 Tax=Paenibacillus puldeungensis TaxID=696536 RepID=A0ABW3S3V0_9BACL